MSVGIETTAFPGSSNLASATYDPDAEDLTVTFLSGDTYLYRNVPAWKYRRLQVGGGSFFYREIRSKHAYEQL